MAINPPTISEFKRNAERQAREQRTTGSLLSVVVWVIVGGLVLVTGLAGYGGYILSNQIKNQAVTVQQLQTKTEGDLNKLQEELTGTRSALSDVVIAVNKQQQSLLRLNSSLEEAQAALRVEKNSRQSLERRLRSVESAKSSSDVQSR